MNTDFREELKTLLPDTLPYPWFPEREGAWLLSRRMGGPCRIADLRRGPLAGLLARPGVREVAAAAGDGWLTPRRLLPLADPLTAFRREHEARGDRPAEAAYDVACLAEWRDMGVSIGEWSRQQLGWHWREMQLSRPGGNLVLQLNLSEAYTNAFEDLFGESMRRVMDHGVHPVRRQGPITLAWARLDFDTFGEDLLIEEIQSDWVRRLCYLGRKLEGSSRALHREQRCFVQRTRDAWRRDWARAMMLAVLAFGVREIGARRFWMHQPHTGARLKNIRGELPPRSIYTDLPRRFGFVETTAAPPMLTRARPQAVRRLRRSGRPVFWRLDLPGTVEG